MSRRGENIYKRKDGRWEGRYIKSHESGKARYGYVYSKTYREVKAKLSAVTDTMQQSVLQENASAVITFKAAATAWLDSQKSQLKQSSIVKYTNLLSTYLYPYFGTIHVTGITRENVILYSNELLYSGGVKKKGLSPKTVSSILSVLKSVLLYAEQTWNYTVISIEGVSVKQVQKPMRVLTLIEQKSLSEYLTNNLSCSNLGIMVCLYTGIRIGEICALKWEDISFDEQTIYIHKTMQRIQTPDDSIEKTKIIITEPKSVCSVRKIPLPDELFKVLKENRERNDAFLLTGHYKYYIEPRTMQNRFKAVINECHIEDANFHALRHTFATRCIELGFDIKSLSEILGHASVNITLNRYVHPSMELKQRNMNKLSDLFVVK
jgi:integrase